MKNILSFKNVVSKYDYFLFDQWGVLHNGHKKFIEAEKCLEYLTKFCNFLSNNSYILIGRNNKNNESCSLYLYLKKENKILLLDSINNGWDYEKKEIFL